jgi:hypothetical protein
MSAGTLLIAASPTSEMRTSCLLLSGSQLALRSSRSREPDAAGATGMQLTVETTMISERTAARLLNGNQYPA